MVQLGISHTESASLLKDPNFSRLQLFANLKSPMPPHELRRTNACAVNHRGSNACHATACGIANLDVLHVSKCANVSLPLFLIHPKRGILDQVRATINTQITSALPLLEVLDYWKSHSPVEQIISPPPRFNTPVVLWSNLRVLTHWKNFISLV